MNHADKIVRWNKHIEQKGWSKMAYPGLHDRVLKLVGIECPPAVFWSPLLVAFLTGIFFGIFWATFMYFSVWTDRTLLQISVAAIASGFCFGVVVGICHWYMRKKLQISTWEEFTKKLEAER